MKQPASGIDIGRVGRQLRLRREQSGRTQAQLAREAGLSERAVRELEAGRTNPTLATVACMTAALGITLDELVAAAREHPAADWTPGPDSSAKTTALTRLLPNPRMQARIVQLSGNEESTPPPSGAVFGHVLEGSVAIMLDNEETSLVSGDSFHARGQALREWRGHPSGRLLVVQATDEGRRG